MHYFWFGNWEKNSFISFITVNLRMISQNFQISLNRPRIQPQRDTYSCNFWLFQCEISQWDTKNSSISEEILIASTASLFQLNQRINKPSNILESSSSYIKLIFTLRLNLASRTVGRIRNAGHTPSQLSSQDYLCQT